MAITTYLAGAILFALMFLRKSDAGQRHVNMLDRKHKATIIKHMTAKRAMGSK